MRGEKPGSPPETIFKVKQSTFSMKDKSFLHQRSRPKFMTLNEQQCFVWDTASQRTKRQDMLEILGGMDSLATPMVS